MTRSADQTAIPTRRARASFREEARLARSHPRRAAWGRLIALAIVLAGVLDAFSTELALSTGGAYELNPVIRSLQEAIGLWWLAPKLAAHVLLGLAIMWFPNRPTLIAMALVSLGTFAVALNNIAIYADIIARSSV